jgi:hypothetical protein
MVQHEILLNPGQVPSGLAGPREDRVAALVGLHASQSHRGGIVEASETRTGLARAARVFPRVLHSLQSPRARTLRLLFAV